LIAALVVGIAAKVTEIKHQPCGEERQVLIVEVTVTGVPASGSTANPLSNDRSS
jgi:hypothetical protein